MMRVAQQLNGLPKVSAEEHKSMWKQLKRDQMLDEEAMKFMDYADDLVAMRQDSVYHYFESLMYNHPLSPLAVRT
jgi:hypothetical protein